MTASASPPPTTSVTAARARSLAHQRNSELAETTTSAVLVGSLSPSRAGDFLTCPLLYRFRVLDKLPEPTSSAATRGTVVHRVLEQLYDLPRERRQADVAAAMVTPAWHELLAAEPDVGELFADDTDGTALGAWLVEAQGLVRRYFELEDPTVLDPAEREFYVNTTLELDDERGLRLHGYIDRLDAAPNGALRVVDYKSGRAPGEGWEAKAMFQLRFYALVLWRMRGVVPRRLQLVYLGSKEILAYEPDETDLLAVQRKVLAVWNAIERAHQQRDWRPNRGKLCDWCQHKALCPAWGGTPPPIPDVSLAPTSAAVDVVIDELPSPRSHPDDV